MAAEKNKIVSQQEYEAAKKLVNETKAALADAMSAQAQLGDPIYKGVTYVGVEGRKKLQSIVDKLKVPADKASKSLEIIEAPIKKAQDEIAKINKKLNVPDFEKRAGAKDATGAEKERLIARKTTLEKELNVAPPISATTKKAEPKTVTPAMTAAKVVTPEAAAVGKPATVSGPKTTTGAGAGTGGKGGGAGTGTGTGTGKGGKGGKGGKTEKVKPATDWSTIVQQEFGPLWDVYNTNPDVKKVLDDAVAGGYFNDEVQMAEKLRGTSWFQTTERSARQFAIRQSTDPAQVDDEINIKVEDYRASALANGFTFDDATLRKLATDATKYGWSATQAQNAIGSEAVAQAQGRGAQGMADLRSGTLGQNLRKIAAGYAQKPSDSTFDQFVIDIMNGTKTETQFTDAMRESAKSQFRSLQPGLDKGSDVDTLLAGYKQQAAQVLGTSVDTSQIDWTSDKWNKALNYRDEKTNEYRQMDLWEWNKYLRTLPEWQNTEDAKQTYQNVAYSLAKGFGRMPQ